MNFNYQKARDLMVENQLRPNKIQDPNILKLFRTVQKEVFLPEEYRTIAYSDLDINISCNRGYLKNLHLAQLINSANIEKNHKILHLGGLTGYVSVLLSYLCKEVIVVESSKELKVLMENNITDQKIDNIKVIEGDMDIGFAEEAPYDLIFIDSPLTHLQNVIRQQINKNQGKIILIQKDGDYLNQAFKIIRNHDKYSKEYLFDVFTKYELYEENKGFIF